MDQLDTIRERISIVDFISESIQLKKAGRNFKGLCPFHSEKTPSFVVSPERQIWHCFGCGKGGDIFTFLMEIDRLEFPEALKILAARAGVKLISQIETSGKAKIRERLLSLHHLASEYYQYILTVHKLGERARLYLKERGISDKAVNTFGLGFAPSAWDNLTKFLRKKGFGEREIELAGVALPGRMGPYDRFRNRVIFPLRNHRGETVAFSGRLLAEDVKEAKYINSPETPIYTKGDLLFGLDVTKDAVRKAGNIVVTEGEFDVISSFQSGVANVVAIKGSALTEAQVALIKRFAERIVLSLDRDAAGDAAARRGIEIAERAGLDIRVVQVPIGKDPDEAARENPHLWQDSVKNAQPFYDFLLNSAFERFGESDAYAKKKIAEAVLPAIARIENPIIQSHYIKLIATRLGVAEEKIEATMRKTGHPEPSFPPRKQTEITKKTHEELVEEHLLSLMLQMENISDGLEIVSTTLDPSDFVAPIVKKIFIAILDYKSEHKEIEVIKLGKYLPPELIQAFDKAYLEDLSAFTDQGLLEVELKKTIVIVRRNTVRRKIKQLTTEITTAEAEKNEEKLTFLQKELKIATDALQSLT